MVFEEKRPWHDRHFEQVYETFFEYAEKWTNISAYLCPILTEMLDKNVFSNGFDC